jgi:hypothetical protein
MGGIESLMGGSRQNRILLGAEALYEGAAHKTFRIGQTKPEQKDKNLID